MGLILGEEFQKPIKNGQNKVVSLSQSQKLKGRARLVWNLNTEKTTIRVVQKGEGEV